MPLPRSPRRRGTGTRSSRSNPATATCAGSCRLVLRLRLVPAWSLPVLLSLRRLARLAQAAAVPRVPRAMAVASLPLRRPLVGTLVVLPVPAMLLPPMRAPASRMRA